MDVNELCAFITCADDGTSLATVTENASVLRFRRLRWGLGGDLDQLLGIEPFRIGKVLYLLLQREVGLGRHRVRVQVQVQPLAEDPRQPMGASLADDCLQTCSSGRGQHLRALGPDS